MTSLPHAVRNAARAAAALLLFASSPGCEREAPPPSGSAPAGQRAGGLPDVVLLIVDTLRADRLGCYGFPDARTPAMDRLARGGAQFRTAISQAPVTAPSVSTILTGTPPPFHGVRDNAYFDLDDSVETLAESFARVGYETGAFVSSAVLEARYGFARGFGTYDADLTEPFRFFRPELHPMQDEHQNVERRGWITAERAVRWLRPARSAPSFALVHLFDPHDPYDPPPAHGGRSPSLYDAEVAAADDAVRAVLRALEEKGGDALVALVADHGEGLGEHGELVHGFFVYDSTMRVPWLLRRPGGIPAGTIVPGGARLVDVAATLVELAGTGEGFGQGRSQAAAILGGGSGGWDPAWIETHRTLHSYGWSALEGIRTERWKLIEAPRPELYDLREDPRETTNLHAALPDTARALADALADLRARTAREDAAPPRAVDDETRRRLEALGYVTAAEAGAGASVRMDPKDGVPGFQARQDAKGHLINGRGLQKAGRLDEAEAAFREALEIAPDFALCWFDLSQLHRARGRRIEEEAALRRAVELDPAFPQAWTALGFLTYVQGRDDEAGVAFRTAWQRGGQPLDRTNLHEFHVRTGRWNEALVLTEAEKEAHPDDPWPARARAFTLACAGRYEEETRALEDLPPGDRTARYRKFALRVRSAAPRAFEHLARGEWQAALPLLESAAAETPDGKPLAWALARARAETGDAGGALELLAADPTTDPLLDAHRAIALARALHLQRRDAEAMPVLVRALNETQGVFEPYRAELWLVAGQVGARLGRTDARTFLSKALDGSYGRHWEDEALAGGGRLLMRRD